MAGYSRNIQTGPAGTIFTNDTPKVQYQFHVAGINTCGVCYQFSEAVSNGPWPIPYHYNCRCRQSAIAPGAQASQPFIDFREEIAKLPHDQQVAVIGASAYKLLEAGVIKWTDVVTHSRIRTLREVVSIKGLPVKTLTGAGVRPKIAEAAHAAVNTPAHLAADAARREALARLQAAGLKPDALVAELSARIAARVSVAEGASYTTKAGEVLGGIKAQRMPGAGGSNAAELAKLLAGYLAVKRAAVKPKKKPKPPEEPPPLTPVKPPEPPGPPPWKPGTAIDPDRPIGERIERAPHLEVKRLAIVAIQTEIDEARIVHSHAWNAVDEKTRQIRAGEIDAVKGYGQLQKLEEKLKEAGKRMDTLKSEVKAKVNEAIKISRLDSQTFDHRDGIGDWSDSTKAGKSRLEARQWFSNKLWHSETDEVTIQWDAKAGIRANAPGERINVSDDDGTWVHVHELGHVLEHQIPSIKRASHEFLKHRVGDQRPQQLNKLFPGSEYRDDEMGRDDDFGKAFGKQGAFYVGKDYGEHATEILSKGLEQLHESPVAFARDDPEFFKFVLGILDGSMRKP